MVIDQTSEPIAGIELIVTLPDGTEETHTTDANGQVHIDGLDTPGACTVRCPLEDGRIDRSADFVGMGETPLTPPGPDGQDQTGPGPTGG